MIEAGILGQWFRKSTAGVLTDNIKISCVTLTHGSRIKEFDLSNFWLSISESEQRARISKREKSPLTNWKLSPNDKIALSYYDQMTLLKERVLTTTKNWHSINYNDKSKGRLELITTLNNLLGEKS